ncbi:hypothetical protein ES708_25711 [subsurface metagenome]
MSTRCLVTFSVLCRDHYGEVIVYKHYDGNPKVMIPFLKEFIGWNKDEGGNETDPGSIGANFIYWAKMKAEKGVEDSEENFGKFVDQVSEGGVKYVIPVGNYGIYSDKIIYLMPLAYLYSVSFYLKIPKEFDDAPAFLEQNIFGIVDRIEIVVGEPKYKDIVKNEDGAPILKIDKIETIDTIEIKRGEGEKNE